MTKDFLVEIGTEELPPKALLELSQVFAKHIKSKLLTEQLINEDADIKLYASPRRLAVLVSGVREKVSGVMEAHYGPPTAIAFDKDGKPTKAAEAFANKLGVSVETLGKKVDPDDKKKTEKVYCEVKSADVLARDVLPATVSFALDGLPIPKRMRWGARKAEFVRPVHWLVMLLGSDVVDCEIMEQKAGRATRGHRFHSAGELPIENPADYERLLKENHVIASFEQRKKRIEVMTQKTAEILGGTAVIDAELLNEVTALVEWPVALAGKFDDSFLEVPAEALISSMGEHQKYFHVLNKAGKLLPRFITIANIDSKDPEQVIEGNERVIRPRLSDAAFFYQQDLKSSLESRLASLKKVVFQEKLGTIYDKAQRISKLAAHIAAQTGANKDQAARAALLCKADLVSDMVLEFDKMQGAAGRYYALNDGEEPAVAEAIAEHYLPKQAGGEIPPSAVGAAIALADRLDTLVGIFGVGQKPTGSKDPFALRRAAIGTLSILLGRQMDLGLYELLSFAEQLHREQHSGLTVKENLVNDVLGYILERFRAIYIEEGIKTEAFNAVAAKRLSNATDIDKRVRAVATFSLHTDAQSLASANKRVGNILAKSAQASSSSINPELLQQDQEKTLYQLIEKQRKTVSPLVDKQDYSAALSSLAELKIPIDDFFDHVMVNTDDQAIKNNRLALLAGLRSLFLLVADISHLVVEVKSVDNQ